MAMAKNTLTNQCPVDIVGHYEEFIDMKSEENFEERYRGKEDYYHASGIGMCSRKLYYQTVMKAEITNPSNSKAKRIMRLGSVLHEDIQDSLIYINNIYNCKDISLHKEKLIHKKKVKFHIEKEIIIESLKVRGFYDCVAEQNDLVYLLDFKTIGSYPYKLKFGRNPSPNSSIHQELQLGTYGYAVRKEFGRLDGMYLYYYNKDTSVLRPKPVPLSYVDMAYNYWVGIKQEHAQGLPPIREGTSPVQTWTCNYCEYADLCGSPFKSKSVK